MVEGAPAHFEATLLPIDDSKLIVEWLKDGRPIVASNRISTCSFKEDIYLDIKDIRPSDAGKYSIRAYNALGDATVSANLQVVEDSYSQGMAM